MPKPIIELDPKRAGYCHAYRLHFRNARIGLHQDGEARYANRADAEADADVYRSGKQHGDDEVLVDRIYTSVEGLTFGTRVARATRVAA